MNAPMHPQTASALAPFLANSCGSVIFHGAQDLSAFTTALELAKIRNCHGHEPPLCSNCRQIDAGTYPDLKIVQKEEKASIGIEPIRELLAALTLQPYYVSGTRIVIINQADILTLEAQNALLKVLEDVPPRTLIILVAEHIETLLPTIRSRCQTVTFLPLGLAANASRPDPSPMPRQAQTVINLSYFERFRLAATLLAEGANLETFGRQVHSSIIGRVQQAELTAAAAAPLLGALERYRAALRAKVAPKVAIECLMLELG